MHNRSRPNFTRVGAVANNLSQINAIHENHSKLIKELINKTNIIKDLENRISELSTNQAAGEEVAKLQQEFTEMKTGVEQMENSIKSAIDNAVATYDTETSDDVVEETRSVIVNDFPYEVPTSEDGSDGININGVDMAPTIKDEHRLMSIKTDYGGISIDKYDSDNRWILERNTDDTLAFHFNSDTNVPLKITPDGVTVDKLQMGDHTIQSVANTINKSTISSKSIPTTKAIVNYINANLLKMSLKNTVSETSTEEIIEPVEEVIDETRNIKREEVVDETPTEPINAHVSTADINGLNTLVVKVSDNSITVGDSDQYITMKPSLTEGLVVSNNTSSVKYSMKNDSGILCAYSGDNIEDLKGKFIEYTGEILEIDGLKVMVVNVPERCSSAIFGVVTSVNIKRFVANGVIHDLSQSDKTFVIVHVSGLHDVRVESDGHDINKGTILIVNKNGIASKASDSRIQFAQKNYIPIAKIVKYIPGSDRATSILM